ncbi:MAG: GHKL domain-containing protein [Nitrososphaeria archaeon]|nr:GHKL domain-containing protein [Nitrososphaeria archaeon]NDB51183.1 GHKL domain-containing protein [Nitrosopumilaceae archaeon]NDB87670.1 GHKL domain-containing protein [Nitrososphaerota archaeon]NDB63306.1 GHKL domain-containing protein [Nitrosopumilaceae archaeon]NDB89731.1 GHKL domain-containing protein [Nitrososphaerota archaeon]
MGAKSGILESYGVDNTIKNLQKENKILLQKLQSQNRMIISYERKLASFDTVKEQRDWLLDEMTKKVGELSHFQTELFKAERLSAIGEMSARIAHDMRNPLSIIKNSIELVKLKYSEHISSDVYTLFTSIDNASSRLVFQLDDVLNFVRSSPLDCSQHSLGKILDSSIHEIVIPDQIIINKPNNDVQLFCDEEKIKAVFTNLIMNSIQAMDSHGTITVQFFESSDDVKFTIQDEGSGIPKNLIDKIFEPLFTTKSRGTGLGLPAVKMIIQQHQGTITVSNSPTIFSITIPKRS